MDVTAIPAWQRQLRSNIRAFLLVATADELRRELEISVERNDEFRAACIRELIAETATEDDELSPDPFDMRKLP